jgi:hypothetical protein
MDSVSFGRSNLIIYLGDGSAYHARYHHHTSAGLAQMVWLNIGEETTQERQTERKDLVAQLLFFAVYEGNKFNSAITHARFEDISARKWSQ